jgi:hypothetical protein
MRLFLLCCLIVFSPSDLLSQKVTYTTPCVPHSVTYNGSDNPNECWESVDFGLLIEADGTKYFFSLSYDIYAKMKKELKDQEITVEVIFYEEPWYDSGSAGNVTKITHNGTVVFSQN